MREISSLTLVLSEKCNFSCPYCPQRKGKNTLTIEDIAAFLDFLQPRLARTVRLGFYGGEPLLSLPLVEKTVAYAEKKYKNTFRFALTTNGSLLQKEHILFFREQRFTLGLSYDGMAQKDRDAGSVGAVESALENLLRLYPAGYMVNSVFTPRTVPLLAASIGALLKRGHQRLRFALDTCVPWRRADLAALKDQLDRVAALCLEPRRKTRGNPLENFASKEKKGVFACFAGRDRLALLPDRTVWGCDRFHTLFGRDPANPDYARYCFGTIEEFMSKSAKALAAEAANYAELRQDYFFSEKKELCSLCDDLENCSVCPAQAALATRTLAVIPSWTCRIRRITRAAATRFT